MLQQGVMARLWLPRLPTTHWLNENDRQHWSKLNRTKTEWKYITVVAANRVNPPLPQPPMLITPVFYFSTKRRRDPVNFFPTIKPIIDQLVTLGWWADDTPEYVDYGTPRAEIQPREGVVLLFEPKELS